MTLSLTFTRPYVSVFILKSNLPSIKYYSQLPDGDSFHGESGRSQTGESMYHRGQGVSRSPYEIILDPRRNIASDNLSP